MGYNLQMQMVFLYKYLELGGTLITLIIFLFCFVCSTYTWKPFVYGAFSSNDIHMLVLCMATNDVLSWLAILAKEFKRNKQEAGMFEEKEDNMFWSAKVGANKLSVAKWGKECMVRNLRFLKELLYIQKKKVFADRNTFLLFGYHFRYKALLL